MNRTLHRGARAVALVAVVLGASGGAASATARGQAWKAPAPQYAVKEIVNFPFTTSDGTELVGSVYYPVDPQTGARAGGRFPVLVDMTPYGLWDGNSTSPRELSDDAILRYFATHGYIGVELDARGTGRSAGAYSIWDPQQSRDDAELIDYAAHRLDGSNGVVGLAGMSYRGMNQLMVGGLLRPGTPVKAMAPASCGAFAFNRPFFMGGFPGLFLPAYQAIESLSEIPPPDQVTAPGGADPVHLGRVAADRRQDALYHAQILADVNTGGSMAHDDRWWQQRDPIHDATSIVKAGVPTLITSGPNDFFASDSLRMYSALQSVAHGHSPWAPMSPRWPPDRRYQIVWGNGYSDGDYAYYLGYELQWYDHWLKGIDNGIGLTATTLHAQVTGGDAPWVAIPGSAYPMTRSYTPFYLGAGGSLTAARPRPGKDTLAWAPGQSITYTTAPFAKGATLAGPVDATIHAASTAPDVELVATLNDVAPDGTATTVVPAAEVDGALDGALRATDRARSWTDSAGRTILPEHPFTSTGEQPVPSGKDQRYDVELLPRLWSVQPGHSLQLVLASQSPILQPTAPQLAALAGGSYTIGYGGDAASYLNLPLLAPDAFARAGDPTALGLGA